MPDISEYRLGSACRINNSDQFSEKADSEASIPDPSSSNALKLEECIVPVQELQHVVNDNASSDDNGFNNNNSNMEDVTCCCHDSKNECGILNDSNSSSWLRRLFTSSLFNLDMTIQYLFKSEDVNVQMYLADRLFGFPESDVDFYLLQLVSLYEKSPSLAEHLTNYFIYRCTKSVSFAINLVWLLDAFSSHSYNPLKRVSSILLNRPSSVPVFSYVSNQLYLMNSSDNCQSINSNSNNSKFIKLKSSSSAITPLQELDYHNSNNGDENYNTNVVPTPNTTTTNNSTELSNDNRFVYTAQTLRDLLLPIDETTWGSFIPQSIVNGSYNMGSYNNVNTHYTHNTSSPSSNCKLSPNIHHNIGHKRSTSDVTSLRNYHYYVDKSRHRVVMDQLDLMNNTETNQTITTITSNPNRWSSSQDSAVCLSTIDDIVNNPITTQSNQITNQISLNSICPMINHLSNQTNSLLNENRHSLHQLHLNNLNQNPIKSSMSMNKIITKEILPQSCLPKHSRSSVNLQRLNSSLCIMNDDNSAQIKSSSSLNQTATVRGENNHRNDVDRNLSSYSTNNITSDLMLGSLEGVPVLTTITLTKTKSINEARNNPTHTMESCSSTTESSSPLDSGLYMTAPNRCIHSSCDGVGVVDHGDDDDDNDNHGVKLQSPENSFHLPHCPHYHTTSSVMYRTLTLRNYLVPRIIPEWDFVDGLLRIARRLVPISPKEQRTAHLQAELANLNLHLPARVWLPVNKAGHIVLRIPPTAAVCLNSKDKAPFLIYVEILCCDDPSIISLPSRPITAASSKSSNSLSAVYPWNPNSHTGCFSSNEITENHEINVNTRTSDELSLRSSSISSNVSLSEELINPIEFNHHHQHQHPHYHLTIDEMDERKEHTTKCTHDQFELNETIMKDDSFTATDSITVTNANRSKSPIYIGAGEIRNRLKEQCELQPHKSFRCDPEDPSAAVLKEPWHVKCERIRATSPWGSLPGWILTSAIVKVGDDLRQEQLAYQLLTVLKNIWSMEYVPLWLRPLTVVVISSDSGFIEPVPDTVSFHQIKRHAHLSLLDYMHREHGGDNSEEFLTAQRNFLHSCAAYCLVGYLFQVKDRHNGNILLDNQGHVIHIDYGFILSSSPGKNLGFETSPFKLTLEQIDVIGGLNSDLFEYFKFLLLRGLLAARKHMEQICVLVEIAHATCPQLPCFARGNGCRTITDLRQRFQLSRTEEQLKQLVDQMVHNSLNSVTTKLYDSFQYYTNGIQ